MGFDVQTMGTITHIFCLIEENYLSFLVHSSLQQRAKDEPVVENGSTFSETKTISTENGRLAETQDKDVVSEDSNTVSVYNQWTAPQTSGQRPKARYEVIYFFSLF